MRYMLALVVCITMITYTFSEEVVFVVDKDSVDYSYVDLFNKYDNITEEKGMDVEYNIYRLIKNNGNNVEIKEYNVYNIPAYDEFNIDLGNDKYLHVEFEKNGNNISYKKIELIERVDFCNKNTFDFFGTTYNVSKYDDEEIVLMGNKHKIATGNSFEYMGLNVTVKAIQPMTDAILVEVHESNESYEYLLCGCEDCGLEIPCGILYYEKSESNIDKGMFVFYATDGITLKDGEIITSCSGPTDYIFHIRADTECNTPCCTYTCPTKKLLSYEYRYTDNLSSEFNLFNCTVKFINIDDNGMAHFEVHCNISNNIYYDDVDDIYMIDKRNNIFLVRKDDKLYLYENGVEKSIITEYYTLNNDSNYKTTASGFSESIVVFDDNECNLSNIDSDVVVIGGPLSNAITKELIPYMVENITNNYPGANTGIIQKIKNPYNPNYDIYVLAGSDRGGTKACVMAYSMGMYDDGILKVMLDNDKPVIIK